MQLAPAHDRANIAADFRHSQEHPVIRHPCNQQAATGMPTHQTRFPLLKEKESVQMSWNASSEDN
eukprot:1012150-Pelagomonas_calceolata.AAC.3